MGKKGAPLPYDAEVEYIETSGTQRINTGVLLSGITGKAGSHIVLSLDLTNTTRGTYQVNGWGNNPQLGIRAGTTAYWQNYATGNQAVQPNVNYVVTLDLSGVKGVLKVDGYNDLTAGGNTSSVTRPFVIGAMVAANGTYQNPIWEKIRFCKIYDADTLVFDAIPVRVNTTGYLYDKVSGVLFGNEGTGDFIVGPDK